MKQQIIELKKKLLLVELPEDATNLKLKYGKNLTYSRQHSIVAELFDFKIVLIGKLTDIKEEQFAEWVEHEFDTFRDYRHEDSIGSFMLNTRKESFFSALEANEVYFEANEYYFNGCNIVGSYKKHIEFWQEAQEKVWDINRVWLFEVL